MFISSTKTIFLFAVLCFVFIQTAYADIYSQLQFIKISSPKSGQNIAVGEKLIVKYVMQPLIKGNKQSRTNKHCANILIMFLLLKKKIMFLLVKLYNWILTGTRDQAMPSKRKSPQSLKNGKEEEKKKWHP